MDRIPPVAKADGPYWHFIPWPSGPGNSEITQRAWLNLVTGGDGAAASGKVYFIGVANGEPVYLHEEDWTLAQDVIRNWQCPDNTAQISIRVDHSTQPIGFSLEKRAKS